MRAMLVLVAVSGCTVVGGSDDTSAICGPRDTHDDAAVFARLTATSWYDAGACSSGEGLPPTCTRLRLGPEGQFEWTAVSDYPERQTTGAWSFRSRDDASGIACLADGSVIDFALTETGLRWGPVGLLDPDEPQPRSTLILPAPTVAVDPLYVALVDHAWTKTNEMDLYSQPSSFQLAADGTFTAEFRAGECTASGTFSLVRQGARLELWPTTAPNACDLRNGGTPANVASTGDTPAIVGGLLELYSASYRDAAIATDQRSLAFNAYSDAGLTVRATWDGALRTATPTTWSMQLTNATSRAQSLSHVSISATPLTPTPDGFTSAGPSQLLVDRALTETLAAATGVVSLELAFTPPQAAWASLVIVVDSADDRQPYHAQRSYIVQLP